MPAAALEQQILATFAAVMAQAVPGSTNVGGTQSDGASTTCNGNKALVYTSPTRDYAVPG